MIKEKKTIIVGIFCVFTQQKYRVSKLMYNLEHFQFTFSNIAAVKQPFLFTSNNAVI